MVTVTYIFVIRPQWVQGKSTNVYAEQDVHWYSFIGEWREYVSSFSHSINRDGNDMNSKSRRQWTGMKYNMQLVRQLCIESVEFKSPGTHRIVV